MASLQDSVWAGCDLPRFPALAGDMETGVLIIGGGLAGLLCARLLHQAGVDYLLVEADRIAQGVTRNTTAKITAQHGLIYDRLIRRFGEKQARLYLYANLAALEKYADWCQDLDCDFVRQDSFVYSLDQPEDLRQEVRALNRLGFAAEFVRDLPLPLAVAGGVRFPNQARFDPLRFLAALTPDLRIREQTRVTQLAKTTAITNAGRVRAQRIIVATHFPFLNKHGAYFLKLYQHRSYVLALENAPSVSGMYVDAAQNGLSFRQQGELLLLGGGGHRTGKPGSGWQGLRDQAQAFYPGSQEKYHWATQDCMTLDGVPYVGRYGPATEGLYVAAGFNKWGMTSALAAAMLLCDQVRDKPNPCAALFNPSRSPLRPQLAANALEAALSLLTPAARRCPHLGCALKWNPHERTWDCPCHGSRFSHTGRLLDNPATGDLP